MINVRVAFLSLLSEISIQNWIKSDRQTSIVMSLKIILGMFIVTNIVQTIYNKFNHCIVVYRNRE